MSRAHTEARLRLIAVIVACALIEGACAVPIAGAPATAPASPSPRVSGASATAAASENMVWMGDHYFSPLRLTVKVGTTVTWRMLGTQEHDVWSLDGSFHSPTMGPGSTFTHTFTKVGAFKYICLPHHGDGMFGEIIVVP